MGKNKLTDTRGQDTRNGKVCFHRLLGGVSEVVLVFEDDGGVVCASPAVERSFGYRADDVCDSNVFDYLHEEDVGRLEEALNRVRGRPEIEEAVALRFRHVDGYWREAEGSLSSSSDEPGVSGFVLSLRGVAGPWEDSGRGAVPYDAMIRNATDLVALCNEDNTIRYVSPSVRNVLGYEPEELVGVYVPSLVHPNDLEYAAEQAARVVEGLPVGQVAPVRYRRKDGSWVYLESATTNLLDDPEVRGVLVHSRDVTSRVRAEEDIQRLSRNLDAQVPQHTAGLIAAVAQMEDHEPLLRERAESLRNIFEHAAVGIVQLGTDGGWLMANRRFCEMTAYEDREELFRRTFRELVHPEDRDNDLEETERLLAGESRTYSVEKRCFRIDGQLVWMNLTVSLVRDTLGGAKFYVLVAEDITERKRSEAALKQSEEHYRAVVEQATEGIFLVDAEDKRILQANAAFRRLLGYDADGELLELTLHDLVRDERSDVDDYVGRVLAEGGGRIGEKQYRCKDGSAVDVEINARTVRYGARDVLCCVARDITERKQAEEALRLSEERFRYLVQYASDVITIVGLDGTILYESPSVRRVLGYEPEDLVDASLFSYIHPDDIEQVSSALDECLEGGERRVSAPIEVRCRHADGSWRRLEAIGSNLVDKPSVGGIVINSRDVTERKRAEASLERNLDMLLALHEANRTLSSTLEVEEIASHLLEIMQRVSELHAAGVHVLAGERWRRAGRTVGSEELWNRVREATESVSSRRAALEDGRSVVFRLSERDDEGRPLVGLYLPLRTRNDVVGVLEAYGPESLAEDDTVEILVSLAGHAASALENARLYEQLGEREQRLQDLVGKLLTTQEEERRKVAYEVHDGLAQVAVAAHQHLQVFARRHHWGRPKSQQDLGRILKLVRSTVTESRRIIANLRPTVLDDLGLASAIALEVENLRDSGYRVEFDEKLGEERLPAPAEIALYRVIQEALTNMRKHAQSRRACIKLWRQNGWAFCEVRDWGVGFDPEKGFVGEGPGERIGLSGMQERVVLLGGDIDIWSRPGEGTSVFVGIPL